MRARRRATSVRPTAASATTCCHGSIGMPAVARRRSSGWSGSIAVSALVTASRSGCGVVGDVRGVVRPGDRDPGRVERRACTATDRPDRSRRRRRPRARASSAAALAPAPAAPTTWIRSPARIARGVAAGREPGPDRRRVARHGRRGHGRARRPARGRARGPRPRCARLFAARSPAQTIAADVVAVRVGDARRRSARRASRRCRRPGPAIPVTDDREVAPSRWRVPSAIARRPGPMTAPCASSTAGGTPSSALFASFAVRDERRRGSSRSSPGISVISVARRGRPCTTRRWRGGARARGSASPGARRRARPDRRLPAAPLSGAGSSPAASGGANSHVSGMPLLPSAPSDVPLSVKYVTPGRAGPDLDRLLAGERQRLAVAEDLAGGADARVDLAVDPDLDPGRAALDRRPRG